MDTFVVLAQPGGTVQACYLVQVLLVPLPTTVCIIQVSNGIFLEYAPRSEAPST